MEVWGLCRLVLHHLGSRIISLRKPYPAFPGWRIHIQGSSFSLPFTCTDRFWLLLTRPFFSGHGPGGTPYLDAGRASLRTDCGCLPDCRFMFALYWIRKIEQRPNRGVQWTPDSRAVCISDAIAPARLTPDVARVHRNKKCLPEARAPRSCRICLRLAFLLLVNMVTGCSTVDSSNTDSRPWDKPTRSDTSQGWWFNNGYNDPSRGQYP